jgi:DNA-directed RNA polymerase I, II, and III subunit RPABC2
LTTGDRGVVVSGDPAAAANRGKGGDKAPKEKKIPSEERSTTPYMTKYERARILGTRALQIR